MGEREREKKEANFTPYLHFIVLHRPSFVDKNIFSSLKTYRALIKSILSINFVLNFHRSEQDQCNKIAKRIFNGNCYKGEEKNLIAKYQFDENLCFHFIQSFPFARFP